MVFAVTNTFTNDVAGDADADLVNTNFTDIENAFNQGYSPPIGSVLPWLKSFTNTPSLPTGWVECDGSVLSDAASVYDGQTLPDMNTTQSFLRGSSTSGTTGGADTIDLSHTHAISNGGSNNVTQDANDDLIMDSQLSASQSILPVFYETVMIMRVK